ncbi:MAG TPA: EF-P beta-lysylation protein EpmB [Gammaproteobacteria bacterium]|nr:EF-P beta-lysylation protein EpmB [Gammaproteobacteria bacterium]
MITRITPVEESADWQQRLTDSIIDLQTLYDRLKLDQSAIPEAVKAAHNFSVMAPPGFVKRMEVGNPLDPLLLQVIPQAAETAPQPPGYFPDPVGDTHALKETGVIHKYHGRVLLITTGACAIHCRYCFRRHFPYQNASAHREQWRDALSYIRNNPDIEEVILSGGDPLMLTDSRIDQLITALESIPHLQRLRLHSRLPVVLPERITPALLQRLEGSRLQILMVIHCNHPAEIDDSVADACRRMHLADIDLLNQSVLLNGINNQPDVLEKLFKLLFSLRVRPYYLHLLDKVHGAAHFDVDTRTARKLYADVCARLPGYMTPHLAQEHAGDRSKRILGF